MLACPGRSPCSSWGTSTEAIYNRYAIVSNSDLRAGVEKLAALEGGPRQVLPFRYGEDKAQMAGGEGG